MDDAMHAYTTTLLIASCIFFFLTHGDKLVWKSRQTHTHQSLRGASAPFNQCGTSHTGNKRHTSTTPTRNVCRS